MFNKFIIILWAIGIGTLIISLFIDSPGTQTIALIAFAGPAGHGAGTAMGNILNGTN